MPSVNVELQHLDCGCVHEVLTYGDEPKFELYRTKETCEQHTAVAFGMRGK